MADKQWLRIWPNSATLFDGDGTVLRSVDWKTDCGRPDQTIREVGGAGLR